MSEFTLHRTHDPSGVSGTGDVAWGCEFPDGAVAVRWPGEHASTAAWSDIRDVEAIHGHGGSTVVTYTDCSRLAGAYQRVVPFLVTHDSIVALRPVTVAPHPDHPDRLRLTFSGERPWAFWVALMDGSTHAATHAEVNGETAHTWVSPDGDLWLQYFSPLADDNDPLAIFDREDR